MSEPKLIAVLPGDGIGHEVMIQGLKIIEMLNQRYGAQLECVLSEIGGTAYDLYGHPLPPKTLELAQRADAILLGAVGGPQWEKLERSLRPERALLGLRSALGLFANLRPAILYPELAAASSLKPEVVAGLDIMIVRELTGGIYFGQPRAIETAEDGMRRAYNTMVYREDEIRRIAHIAFQVASRRNNKVCSVDKANVLEVSELWRDVVTDVAKDYSDVELSHMYVDNAAMQLVRAPKQFDVMVTSNLFGDILSDEASMLTGSIGMLPSASLDENGKGMYEPVHGSAPDIAGENKANPLATILSVSMMLRNSLGLAELADRVETGVRRALENGYRTGDIALPGEEICSTTDMGEAVLKHIET